MPRRSSQDWFANLGTLVATFESVSNFKQEYNISYMWSLFSLKPFLSVFNAFLCEVANAFEAKCIYKLNAKNQECCRVGHTISGGVFLLIATGN